MSAITALGTVGSRRRIGPIIGRLLLWGWLLAALVPLVFMVITSIKPSGIAKSVPPQWVFKPTLEHYQSVMSGGSGTSVGFDRLLFNSVAVTLGATVLTVAVAVPAAYALSLRCPRGSSPPTCSRPSSR